MTVEPAGGTAAHPVRARPPRGARRIVDAHAPVAARRVPGRRRRLARVRQGARERGSARELPPGDHAARALDRSVPLEAQVERHAIPFRLSRQVASLNIRVLMGREWSKLLDDAGLHTLIGPFRRGSFRCSFPIRRPRDDTITAHRSTWQRFARSRAGERWTVSSKQRMETLGSPRDFGLLAPAIVVDPQAFEHRRDLRSVLGVVPATVPPAGRGSAVEERARRCKFACSCGSGETARSFAAEEYYPGHLDWYNLDLAAPDVALRLERDSHRSRRDVPPGPGRFQRHAQHALVGVRGPSRELRRHHAGQHRSREAPRDGVRARVRERLVQLPGASRSDSGVRCRVCS